MTVHKLIILMILVTMVITSALATEQSWGAQVLGIEPNKTGPNTPETLIHQHRAKLLSGTYGSTSITDLIQLLTEISGGPEIQQISQVLAVRKNEVVPIVKEKLRTGRMWEKHMLTKLLRYSPWPEVHNELIDLARDTNEHWLPRQGALYALGELGNPSAGPEVLAILNEPDYPAGVQLVTISTLARIGYRKAASAIRLFTEHEDVHIRLFACRALAEFGESVDRQFLLSALEEQDYVIRQEACGALVAMEGEDITQRLQSVAEHDFHESVRATARIGLLDRKIRGRTPSEKLRMLRNALEPAERRTAPWIIQTILNKCGPEGRAFAEQLSIRDDRIGERARAFLIAKEASLSTSPSGQEIQTEEIEPLHASTPTHQTLMEYATSKAASLETPLSFTSTQQTRMGEGSVDEDDGIRPLNHGYRPLDDGAFPLGTTARNESATRWTSMSNAFSSGQFDGGDGVGAWHYLGRVSHLLQDMSSPLHTLGQGHAGIPYFSDKCQFEEYWKQNDSTLRSILNSIGSPLYSGDTLPSEATAKLDSFTQERLQYRYNNNCPYKNNNDVRGWIEVLAWVTYFRATFWGEIIFGSSGGSGPATSSQTTGTTFDDGYVGAKTNTLNTMFNGNVQWIASGFPFYDNYYEITDRNGYVFRYMSYTDIDDWSSCGRSWVNGQKDSSKRFPTSLGPDDEDERGARVTGRFWFDTRELGKDSSGSYNRRCYPNRYPNGNSMTDDFHLYYGKYGYPLTVRYNAGLLGLANRRATVNTNYGQANGFTWSRKDNFGNGPTFNASTSNSYFYFVAKSSVNLTAPQTNTSGESFVRWDKNGASFSTNRTITINTSSSPIPRGGVIYTAIYVSCTPPSIISHPQSQTVCEGSSVTFNVTAIGTAPLSYQWRKNGSSIPGASGSSYTINPVTTAHAGNYDCVVTNSCGSDTSNSATLTVNTPPSPPSNFSDSSVTTDSITWTWQDNSNNEDGFRGHDPSHNIKWTAPANTTSKTESGLSVNTQYTRHVHAYNTCGESSPSNGHSVYTLANAPGPAAFSNITRTSIQANWTANGNPPGTQYFCENVTRGTDSGWTSNTYWNETGLDCGTQYCYQVKAKNGDGVPTATTNLGCQSTLPCPVPDIRVSESSYDYNSVVVGSYEDWILTIYNDGGANLSITDFNGLEASDFNLVGPPSLPFTIEPNDSNDLTVRFTPSSGGIKTAILSIANTDLDEDPTDVNLVGIGVPSVIYVDADANGANNGTNWTDAYINLQDALSFAANSGGDVNEIRVAQGIYKPDQGVGIVSGDREATFQLINGVTLTGGYAGFGEPDPNLRDLNVYHSILSGDLNGDDDGFTNNEENSYHVVTSTSAVLDGFIITAGNGNAEGTGYLPCHGGGIYASGNQIVSNCIVRGNRADRGGGMYCEDGTVTNCTFTNNSASASQFAGGLCSTGSPTIKNCLFINNNNGGMTNTYSGHQKIMNCTFIGNSVRNNQTWHLATMTNCTFVDGSSLSNYYSNVELKNCIFWGASISTFYYDTDYITRVSYCNVQGGEAAVSGDGILDWGPGNIDADPCFVNPNINDFHLLPKSLCIDSGDPNYVADANEVDIDGDARIIGGRIDMGADEYAYGELSDFNGDGIVNFRDFSILAYYWMDYICEEPYWCEGSDFDESRYVDFADLKTFAENWLWHASEHILSVTAVNGFVTKTPDKASYSHGEMITLQAVPDTGYHFVNWSGDLSGNSNPATIVMVSDKSVTANFAANTYTITASAGPGGQISPSGTTQVVSGGSQTYNITSNPGYHISDVLADGSSVGPVSSYTFTNVTADHTIAASFAIDEEDVTAPTVTNCSPAPDAIQVPLNTLIILHIVDTGTGVDANSVVIKVNHNIVYAGNTAKYSSPYGNCYRSGTKADYTFIYQANQLFDFDQTVSVTVNTTDLAGNVMGEYSYSFTTETQ